MTTNLFVLDLETTGLSETRNSIIEIGCIAVDPKALVAVDVFAAYVRPWEPRTEVDPVVLEMHTHSGLWAALDDVGGSERWAADAALEAFLKRHLPEGEKAILAGNSIAFDVRFIQAQLPRSRELLSHRTYDISATRRLLTDLAGIEFPKTAEMPHRALLDCRIELTELRALVSYFQRADESLSAISVF